MLSVLRNTISYTCGALVLSAAQASAATPTLGGQSGYVNMPSALVEADGTFSLGYSYDSPYATIWATTTILPFLQATGRYVAVSGTRAFSSVPGDYGSQYGRNKDKVVDIKLRLLEESTWLPAVAYGRNDLFGTELFKGQFLVATKTFGTARNMEVSIGKGTRRPAGVFAGARWTPVQAPRWSVVAEYDANDYKNDYRATETSAGKRDKGPVLGLEYRWGWLGAQVARHRDHFSANVYASIPMSEREFIPKLFEPKPYTLPKDAPARLSLADWQQDGKAAAGLVQALARQDFKNIRVVMDGTTLKLSLTNTRIANMGRAVGRASRTALALAPVGTKSLHVTYTKAELPLVTYEFFDIDALANYLNGQSRREDFMQTVLVRYADPSDRIDDDAAMLAGLADERGISIQSGQDGNIVQASYEDRESNRFKIVPKLGFFFNDPSGALRYEVAALANYDRRLGAGLYFNSAFKLNVLENITGVTQPSNSNLPHVRTDVAEYKRGGRFKMTKLLVNKFVQPQERWYARGTFGCYEEMYCGAGGQVLYLPKDERWAADLSVDALQQRGFKGWFDTRDYRTVSTIGALHYKLPYDITATARAGRFLARDEGVRVEFKRRFRSGIEVGAWYTKTNGKDITSPGTPSSPYNDKGVFLSIPLNTMLPVDSQASAGLALSPWTRDVGQMVNTPGDLYELVEQPRRDVTQFDGMGNFAERADEQNRPEITMPVRPMVNPWPQFRARIEQSVSSGPRVEDWVQASAVAGGAVLASALLDKPTDRLFKRRADGRVVRGLDKFGKNMPLALVGLAGASVAFGDERMQNIGLISLQSVVGSLGLSTATKYLVQRARPSDELGPWKQIPDGNSRSSASFPSRHAATAFAAVTPFAQEYDAPWLYGLAAVSSMGRVAGRHHWVSDTVAGGVMGYAVGTWLWRSQRDSGPGRLSITPGAKEISVAWSTQY